MTRNFTLTIVMAALVAAAPAAVAADQDKKMPKQDQAQAMQNTGEHEIATVNGLNGALYEAYKPSVVKEVQQALKQKNLYLGKVDGDLDQTTMDAIAAFQKDNNLVATGIPTPNTRQALLPLTKPAAS